MGVNKTEKYSRSWLANPTLNKTNKQQQQQQHHQHHHHHNIILPMRCHKNNCLSHRRQDAQSIRRYVDEWMHCQLLGIDLDSHLSY